MHPALRDLLAADGEVVETHISWVLLQGHSAWKLKKPVALGFLDFRDLEQRRQACLAELRLNRRLAPQVYREVVPVVRGRDGRHRLGGQGETVDWAVHMRRLPLGWRADQLLQQGRLTLPLLQAVASKLARFHAEARCDEQIAKFGSFQALGFNIRENFAQTRQTLERYLKPGQAREIESWQIDFLARNRATFDRRRAQERVRDGHGDLRLEHVYFQPSSGRAGSGSERSHGPEPTAGVQRTSGPASRSGATRKESDQPEVLVVDCIEFNQRFRYADVCADIAFLAMDLSWHGWPDLAEAFVAAYAREADDYDLYSLLDFYESYRAFVRGKVASMLAADPQCSSPIRQQAERDARRYFLLSLASGRRSLLSPVLVAVGGVMGVGKSTVAEALAARLSAPVVDADRTRKSLLGVSATAPQREAPWQGAYAPAVSHKVYRELLRRAEVVLRSGRTVILDSSFRSRQLRAAAWDLAARLGLPFLFVECRAEPQLCRERLQQRQQQHSVSDGRLEIFDQFLASWEAVEELPMHQHLVLDTSRSLELNLQQLQERLGPWPPWPNAKTLQKDETSAS